MSFYHKLIKCFTETTTELEKLRKNDPGFHVHARKSAPSLSVSLKDVLHKPHVLYQLTTQFTAMHSEHGWKSHHSVALFCAI
jgi:hypothetical protein